MKNKLILILFIICSLPHFGISQTSANDDLNYEIHRIFPPISISKEQLKEVKTIGDFKNKANDRNMQYDPSWVKEFISVEISTSHKGETKKAVSKNDLLSPAQKELINMADTGSDIAVVVNYMPENNLTHNDPKATNFTFTIEPDQEAQFPDGQEQLKNYLKEKAIDNIPSNTFEGYDLTVVKFTVSPEGEITNAHLFGMEYQSSKNEEIDELLLETIRKMPCWKPAEYANGINVEQEFVLTVGNTKNCIVPMLNIRRDWE